MITSIMFATQIIGNRQIEQESVWCIFERYGLLSDYVCHCDM